MSHRHDLQHTHVHPVKSHRALRLEQLLDRAGAVLGALCAVHCAAAPLMLTLAPLVGLSALWSPEGETILLSCALLLTIPSLYKMSRSWLSADHAAERQSARRVCLTFSSAWVALICAMIVSHGHHHHSEIHSETHSETHSASGEQAVTHHAHHGHHPHHEYEHGLHDHDDHAEHSCDELHALNDAETSSADHSSECYQAKVGFSLSTLGGFGLAFAHLLSLRRRRQHDAVRLAERSCCSAHPHA